MLYSPLDIHKIREYCSSKLRRRDEFYSPPPGKAEAAEVTVAAGSNEAFRTFDERAGQ